MLSAGRAGRNYSKNLGKKEKSSYEAVRLEKKLS